MPVGLDFIGFDFEFMPGDWSSYEHPGLMLDAFVDIATPVLAKFAYAFEARGYGWAHWTSEAPSIIRAYLTRQGDGYCISGYGQGEIPDALREALVARISEATGWRSANPS
jgi:hypothetical protein